MKTAPKSAPKSAPESAPKSAPKSAPESAPKSDATFVPDPAKAASVPRGFMAAVVQYAGVKPRTLSELVEFAVANVPPKASKKAATPEGIRDVCETRTAFAVRNFMLPVAGKVTK